MISSDAFVWRVFERNSTGEKQMISWVSWSKLLTWVFWFVSIADNVKIKLLTYFLFFFVINLQIAILLHLFKNDKSSMSGFALNFINGLVFVSSSLTKTCGRDQNYFESFWGNPLQLIKHTICPCAFHTRRVNCYIISSPNMQRIPYRRLVNTVSPVDRVQL